jgi:PAS domain S-box-containing protein
MPMSIPRRRSAVTFKKVDAADLDRLVDEIRSHATASGSPLRVVNSYIARSAIPALAADDAGYYVAANDAACKLTGFTRVELLQRSVADVTAPRDAAVAERLWNSFIRADHQRGTYALLRKNGTVVLVDYNAYSSVAAGIHLSFLTPSGENRDRG